MTTIFLDTSALLRRYVAAPQRLLVIDAMERADHWVAASISRTETLLALQQLALSPAHLTELWASVRGEWDAFWEIPVDRRAMNAAVELGGRYGLSTVDALQLACASRVPRPALFCTFERQQIPAAAALDFEVVSPWA
ncbi:MAG: type II toxin-antitoxin system VapC family toxin [Acidimicrobiales bacterium]|nr:type II toxin-antitoxin system VapC family toxin [Acidimicrobiales bacterium]